MSTTFYASLKKTYRDNILDDIDLADDDCIVEGGDVVWNVPLMTDRRTITLQQFQGITGSGRGEFNNDTKPCMIFRFVVAQSAAVTFQDHLGNTLITVSAGDYKTSNLYLVFKPDSTVSTGVWTLA